MQQFPFPPVDRRMLAPDGCPPALTLLARLQTIEVVRTAASVAGDAVALLSEKTHDESATGADASLAQIRNAGYDAERVVYPREGGTT